jgi:hypothetical protein
LASEYQEAGVCGVLSFFRDTGPAFALVAQLVERILGKDEVISSILIKGSRHLDKSAQRRKTEKQIKHITQERANG